MAKSSQNQIARRKLFLLQQILTKGKLSIQNLLDLYQMSDFPAQDLRMLKSDLDSLVRMKMPVHVTDKVVTSIATGPEVLWKDSEVGCRLDEERASNIEIARKVVRFMKNEKDAISTVMLGTGTLVFAIAREIFDNSRELPIRIIHTNNLLVLEEYVLRSPTGIKVYVPPGEIDRQCGSLVGSSVVEYLKDVYVDAVVTSFDGFTHTSGFTTLHANNIQEKLMNLQPHSGCKYIIIPMRWENIGMTGIAVTGPLSQTVKRSSEYSRYIIFTNPPSKKLRDIDDRRFNEITKLQEIEGVEVMFVRTT